MFKLCENLADKSPTERNLTKFFRQIVCKFNDFLEIDSNSANSANSANVEFGTLQRCAKSVDFLKCVRASIHLQNSASIQPRRSSDKFVV